MATTLTFICFTPDGYTAAHCGDSRIYHIRPARGIIYRSQDHSLVGEMLRNGVISEAEAAHHPQSNIITRCVMLPTDGPADRLPRVTVHQSSDIQPGDYFLLCTDGVVHQATDPFLVSLLSDTTLTDTEKIAQLARQTRDSSDNNTACLIHIADIDGLRPHTAPAATTSDTSDTPGGQPTPLGPKPTGSTDPSAQSDTRPLKPQGHTATLLSKIKGLFG
jgi:protein phosphatase